MRFAVPVKLLLLTIALSGASHVFGQTVAEVKQAIVGKWKVGVQFDKAAALSAFPDHLTAQDKAIRIQELVVLADYLSQCRLRLDFRNDGSLVVDHVRLSHLFKALPLRWDVLAGNDKDLNTFKLTSSANFESLPALDLRVVSEDKLIIDDLKMLWIPIGNVLGRPDYMKIDLAFCFNGSVSEHSTGYDSLNMKVVLERVAQSVEHPNSNPTGKWLVTNSAGTRLGVLSFAPGFSASFEPYTYTGIAPQHACFSINDWLNGDLAEGAIFFDWTFDGDLFFALPDITKYQSSEIFNRFEPWPVFVGTLEHNSIDKLKMKILLRRGLGAAELTLQRLDKDLELSQAPQLRLQWEKSFRANKRSWTTHAGNHSTEAIFAGFDEAKVVVSLRKRDRSMVEVPLKILSNEDRIWAIREATSRGWKK